MEVDVSEIIIFILKIMEQEIRLDESESEHRLKKLINKMISEGIINEQNGIK